MTELVILRAADEAALVAEARRIVGFLDRVPGVSLADVAYTCTFLEGEHVLAIVAETVADLRARLASAADRIAQGTVKRIRDKSGTYWFREHLLGPGKGKLAFVYPGVMAFYPDMMRDLAILHPECRSVFDDLEEAFAQNTSFTPSNFIYPPAPYYRHDADIFKSGAYAQALVSTYAACGALTQLMEKDGIRPDGVVGFAGGDLAAMVRAGAAGAPLTRERRIQIIREIYKIVDTAVSHGGLPETKMISLLLRHEGEADEALATLPEGMVTLAIDLSPRQKTYAVDPAYASTAISALSAIGVRLVTLELDRPFNTPACERLVPAIRKFVDGWLKEEPTCPIYSCALADQVPTRLKKMRVETAERWMKPVRFTETIRKMHADGYRVFLEVGPRGQMTTAIEDTLKGEEHAAIALNSIHRRGVLQIQHAVAQLAALGGVADIYKVFMRRGAHNLDFDSSLAPETRRETEMRLSRAFPRMTLLAADTPFAQTSAFVEPKGRGAKAAQRAAVVAAQARRRRQFDFGASNPLVSDADVIASTPGIALEIQKTLRVKDMPFVGDFARGASPLSYSDPNLKGLVLMSLPLGAEIMAETAARLVPNGVLVAVEGLSQRQAAPLGKDGLAVRLRAERVASGSPDGMAVKVQMLGTGSGSEFVAPLMEATFRLSKTPCESVPVSVEPLVKPRTVHWSGRDIYPTRLCYGPRLRGITFADAWSESGIDYEVTVPRLTGTVTCTQFPLWIVHPLLLETIVSGYKLWRSHERFSVWRGNERMDDAYSFPFRVRRITLHAPPPKEGAKVKCYLRLTGFTPKSILCDITVSDGNGTTLMMISGWEEYVEHVRSEYRGLIMQPATCFITRPVAPGLLGVPSGMDVSSAYVTDIPYPVFERREEVWLKTFAQIVLSEREREDFAAMSGSTARRTEWLFGRIAAKEAVRRFLKDYHQARWSYADVSVYADAQGKPYAIGEWQDALGSRLDIAIAHTAQFVIALAAANARVGVDVESVSRDLSEEFTAGVFTPEELNLAAGAVHASEAVVRFWCAKEAVSKALGTGIRYSPKEMVVSGYEADAGRLTVRLEGAWAEAFRSLKGRDIPVSVGTKDGHALAFCFIPSSLFTYEQ